MELSRIDPVALDVPDRAAAVAFYTDVLGMDAGNEHGDPGEPVFVSAGGVSLALFTDPDRRIAHTAFATDRAGYEELLERLEAAGVPHRREQHTRNDSIYFADPAGNRIEVLTPR